MQKKFSCPIKIDELNQSNYKYVLQADKDELVDIAEIMKLDKVNSFVTEIFLKLNNKQHILRVWGEVKAEVVLKSVISLKDFIKKYQIPFELIYDTKATYADLKEMDEDMLNAPDIIENGSINLADIAMEQLALNLDDYPRDEGEVFDAGIYAPEPEEYKENPFAVLAKLKK